MPAVPMQDLMILNLTTRYTGPSQETLVFVLLRRGSRFITRHRPEFGGL